jgi:hypothetical protein
MGKVGLGSHPWIEDTWEEEGEDVVMTTIM